MVSSVSVYLACSIICINVYSLRCLQYQCVSYVLVYPLVGVISISVSGPQSSLSVSRLWCHLYPCIWFVVSSVSVYLVCSVFCIRVSGLWCNQYQCIWSFVSSVSVYLVYGVFCINVKLFAGEDLLRLICFCQFLSGSLVLAVGVSGALGTIRESKGWMAVVSSLSNYYYFRASKLKNCTLPSLSGLHCTSRLCSG